MNNKALTVFIIAILIIGAFFLFKNRIVAPTEVDLNTNPAGSGSGIEEEQAGIKDFTIEASSFKFAPANITVNKGDTVRITLVNIAGVHDLKIDEFNAATQVLQAGESESIVFVADKSGTFEFYCSVGTHRQMGMVGKLVVN